MIVFEDNMFQTRSDKPDKDWTGGEAKYVIPDGSELANKFLSLYPWVEFVEDSFGNLVDVKEVPHEDPIPEKNEAEKENDLLKAQVAALSQQDDFKEELIVELANIVYA